MTNDSGKPKKNLLKLTLFAFASLTLVTVIVCAIAFGPALWTLHWTNEVNKATALMSLDRATGKAMVDKAFADAKTWNAGPLGLMMMHRAYANYLDQKKEYDLADQEIQKAIDIGVLQPKTDQNTGNILTHAYQDRGNSMFYRYLEDKTKPTGENDQQKSVEVAETAFGPDHEQTVYKIPTLALIYASTGKRDQADQLMKRVINAVETKDSAKECAWFVYALDAHIKAAQGQYAEAVQSYLKGRKAGTDRIQTGRAWSELLLGLRQNQPVAFDENPHSLKLLNKGNFAELDRLSNQLNKSQATYWDGLWRLDHLCGGIEGAYNSGNDWYDQRVFDLKKWLSKNPKSQMARTALAQVMIYKAWDYRNSDSSAENAKFNRQMEGALKVLNADPELKDQYPRAINPYIREIYVEGDEDKRSATLKIADQFSKRWPTYVCGDTYIMRFLQTEWYGETDDVKKYIEKRSNTIGGAQGDKLYAQLVWSLFDDDKEVSFEDNEYSWKRVKAGFQQIFKEYPKEMEARIAYLRLALETDDHDAVKHAFDGMKK